MADKKRFERDETGRTPLYTEPSRSIYTRPDFTTAIWPPKAKKIMPKEGTPEFDEVEKLDEDYNAKKKMNDTFDVAKGYAGGGGVTDDDEVNNGINKYFAGQPSAQPLPPPPPPVNQAQALSNYFAPMKQAVDQYGPDVQANQADALIQSQHSLGNNVAKGGAGLADAIMQGVARAGNPGFLQNIENRQSADLQNTEEMGKSLNEQNQQGIKEKMSLDQMNPSTPVGNTHAMLPLLTKVMPGLSPTQYQEILSNPRMLSTIMGPATELAGKGIENNWKTAQLGLDQKKLAAETTNQQKQRELDEKKIAAETANQQKERELQGSKVKADALKEFAGLPWYSRLIHPGVSSALEEEAGLGGNDAAEERKTKDGRIALFDPKTKQFKGYK